MELHGTVAPGYEPVREALSELFGMGREKGSQLCCYVRGERVVDLWGGTDPLSGRAWERDSVAEPLPLHPPLDQNTRSSFFCAFTAALHLPAKGEKGAQLPRPIPLHPPCVGKFARLPATVPVMRKSFN